MQIHDSEWNRKLVSLRKLIPMWSVPHRIASRLLNLYTLETFDGLPKQVVFNARRLRSFKPRIGMKLATDELARLEDGVEA